MRWLTDNLFTQRYLMLILKQFQRTQYGIFSGGCSRRSLWSGQVVTRLRLPLLYCHLNRQTDSRAPEMGFLILSSSSMTTMLWI